MSTTADCSTLRSSPSSGPCRSRTHARAGSRVVRDTAGAPTLRAHAYGLLRTILGSAVHDELIPSTPATSVEPATPSESTRSSRPPWPSSRPSSPRCPSGTALMALLAAWCGLRFGELAELRRGDVDTKAGILAIRRGVVRVDGEIVVGTPKSDAGTRDVAIPPHLLPLIREHMLKHAEAGKDGLLFPARGGGHLAPSTLYRVFYPARRPQEARPPLARPAAHRRRSSGSDGRHARRTDGPTRALHTGRCAPLPARRRGPRHGDRQAALGHGREP